MPSPSPVLTRTDWRSHALSGGRTLWVAGDSRCDEPLLSIMDDAGPLAEQLGRIPGHYAAIAAGPDSTVLVADALRSFPIFYRTSRSGTTIEVADNVLELSGTGGSYEADLDSRVEFRSAAYVAGSHTLYRHVHQVQAGEVVSVDASGQLTRAVHSRIRYSGMNIKAVDDVDEHFTRALNATMDRFLERAGGRQLVIPLSGGLDSRLLAVHLKDAGYDNLVNFTYGTADTAEVRISREVSEALGQKWLFCHHEETALRAAWDAPDTAEFIAYAHAGASLPHIQDWYALRWMRREGLVDQDAIFLPGHTIVGNMHDEDILDRASVSSKELSDVLLRHHYNLQPNNRAARNNARLRATVADFLADIEYDGSELSRLTALEYWNVRERQTKYINNSVRNYEFFGYDWALPMLDREMYQAWGDFHPDITRNRDWYEDYVNRRYAAATGRTAGTFAPSSVSRGKRETVKTVLRATGLLTVAERTLAARAVANHPMGFNWFVPGMSAKALNHFIRQGGNVLGACADEFLSDTWNSHCTLFTPSRASH